MRHGQAAYQGADRILTAAGIQEAELTALKLRTCCRITKIYSSPKTRALQTAEAVLSRLGADKPPLAQLRELAPAGDPAAALEEVIYCSGSCDEIMLVSHIPLVYRLAQEMCPGAEIPTFVTAAALILEEKAGQWAFQAFITPHAENFFDLSCRVKK